MAVTTLDSPAITNTCAPVGDEFGTPVDTTLLVDPDFREVVDDLTLRLEHTNAQTAKDLETGEAAGRALKALGCVACELGQICTVKENLEERVTTGEENRALLDMKEMAENAPAWLTATRYHLQNKRIQELRNMGERTEEEQAFIGMQANQEARELLAGVENRPLKALTKADLPELKDVAAISDQEELPAQNMVVGGNTFIVVDATGAVGFKDQPLDPTSLGVLGAKLINKMGETAKDGNPQILHPDQTMQKVLRRNKVGHLDEIRMNGKDRLYLTVTPGNDGELSRLVVLGYHGGDESTQSAMINRLDKAR